MQFLLKAPSEAWANLVEGPGLNRLAHNENILKALRRKGYDMVPDCGLSRKEPGGSPQRRSSELMLNK